MWGGGGKREIICLTCFKTESSFNRRGRRRREKDHTHKKKSSSFYFDLLYRLKKSLPSWGEKMFKDG